MSGISRSQDTTSLPSIGWVAEDLDNDFRRSSPIQCPDAYNGAYNTSPARQRLLYYTDLEDETGSLSWAGAGGSPTWRRVTWALGIICCLLCATIRPLTNFYSVTNAHPNTPSVGPYTKAAIGHAGVAWLSGCVVLIGKGSVRIHSSRHFFLLVGALTFLGVAELLGAHAATFTPFNTLEGLVGAWRLTGSVCFMRLLHRSRLTAGRLLALVLCIVGCLLVSQPEWFLVSNSGGVRSNTTNSYTDNLAAQNYSNLLNSTRQNHFKATIHNPTINHSFLNVASGKSIIPPNGTMKEQLEINPALPQNMTNGNTTKNFLRDPSNSTIDGSTSLRTIQFVPFSMNQVEGGESYNADYLIGCVICSVTGLFAGAWFTVAYVTSHVLPVFTLFFWTSLICAITSSAMALHNELLLFPSSHPEQIILLLTESFGAALVLYGATAGARLTNPIVAAVLLTLPLVANMGITFLFPESREVLEGAVPALEGSVWLGVSGGIVLACGVVYSLALETWRRHRSPRRRRLLSEHYKKLNMGLGESMNSRVSKMTQV